MSVVPVGLLDTSVFIASETGRPLGDLPEETVTSTVVLGELELGVLAATSTEVRARRLGTLRSVADLELLPVDEAVASVWARMRIHLAEAGRRVNVNDLWIAATAAAHGIPVVTQDDDFDPVEGVADFSVLRV